MPDLFLHNHSLHIGGDDALLSGLPETVSLVPDPLGVGVFLRFAADKPAARHVFGAGQLSGVVRFTCQHRYEPFWMTAKAGTRAADVPPETQFLLGERENGTCVVFVPLVDGALRCSLQGSGENSLELVAESGDPAVVAGEVVGLFVAEGSDPFALVEAAAKSIAARMGTGRLRRDKPLPAWVDTFGWCTWDAFYQHVSHEKAREGLQSFADGGVKPRYLILDDGWQSIRQMPTGEKRLTAFAANEKFPGDLGPTVAMTKTEFGLDAFFVWHAISGYWGGVDGDALPGYGVRSVARDASPGIRHHVPTLDTWWGPVVGFVPPETVYRFYQDYHRHLRRQGVDGVKVDTQAVLETVAAGLDVGRVGLMQRYHEALEGSVHTHFNGNLINCMSCANEMLFSALASTLTRTSTDFWPNKPESHGVHLYVNAQVSLFWGEFVHPDWDMFQSGHPAGAYHAAARAISGAPVYVSDKPDAHNFDLLRKLVLPDGGVLRCPGPARPTRDCLFTDPTKENVLLKIFNTNANGLGVLGVFNARHAAGGEEAITLSGTVRPVDIEGLAGERFAVFAHHANELRALNRDETWELTLPQLGCEVFTVASLENGFAPLGLAGYLNGGAAIFAHVPLANGSGHQITLRAGGRFVAWCEQPPATVTINDEPAPYTFDPTTRRLNVNVPTTNDNAQPRLRLAAG